MQAVTMDDMSNRMELFDERGNYLVGGQIRIATRKDRLIPNDRPPERHPSSLQDARTFVEGTYPTARIRSLSARYNCMGMVFAARRVWIETPELQMILDDDEFRKLAPSEAPEVGDVVVYRDESGNVSHVGLIAQVLLGAREEPEFRVLSQWGQDGEYFHNINDVSPLLGSANEFWTDRGGLATGPR